MASKRKHLNEIVPRQAYMEEHLKHKVLRRSKRYRTARSLSNVFKGCSEKKGAKYLEAVSRKITECRGQKFVLKNPDGIILFIGPVEDTEYDDSPADVNGWGKFFLPETVEMKVIGYVTGTPVPCDQFVLMTCENQQVFGYDGEKLYLVASSLNKLCCEGLAYPEVKSYYFGEAFKHMTEDDWEKVKQGPVGKRLEEDHCKLVASFDSTYLKAHHDGLFPA
ncbi:uncharacterized protein LOC119793279 isoform X1 [Cyprinodon tularosa]|uniref:uncharacterized protein LOC119793279 isoform X1 n=1 Tax=Cyprinodon tularosa TaxID=77115 RepID=UPI0018E21D13|nr:uncharacterized protein LOC119793279 isoform X1 [Cyprinodon tularosa]